MSEAPQQARGSLLDRLRASRLPPPEERRAIRAGANVSLREIAEELGVHQVTASKWERGVVQPKMDHALAYRGLLDQLRELARE